MRLHTNTLTESDVWTAVRGTPVPEYAWKHVSESDRTRTEDYCGHGYALGRPAGLTPEGTEEACRHGRTVRYVDTGRLTYSAPADVTGALTGVSVDVMAHGSRSHTRSLEVKLEGTSTRRPNPGTGPRDSDAGYAATWDEWGMFLARLFAADPNMVAGTVKRPTYAGAAHFHWVTDDRYRSLTPADQHRNHRWNYAGTAGRAGRSYSWHECKCGAILRRGTFGMPAAYGDNGVLTGAVR